MGAADLPPEKPRVLEVRRANSPCQAQLTKLMDKIKQNSTANSTQLITQNKSAGKTMQNSDSPIHHEKDDKKAGADASSVLMDQVMGDLMKNASKPAGNELNNLGQINKIDLPGGWKAGPDYSQNQHSASYKEYHPASDPDAQLGFYYRGHRTSEAAGNNFHNLLSKPAHNLTEHELKSLGEVVRDKANPDDFKTNSARTETINGKRVLVIEGEYKENKQNAKHMFVDSDGTGSAVQEIFFQAAGDKFKQYSKSADDAMKSIIWK